MPHLIIDYSRSVEPGVDMAAFCVHMRKAMQQVEAFPLAGIRVRAHAADHVEMADGRPDFGYIDLTIRILEGRPQEVKEGAVTALYEAALDFLKDAMEAQPLGLTIRLTEIDKALSYRTGNIRDYLSGDRT